MFIRFERDRPDKLQTDRHQMRDGFVSQSQSQSQINVATSPTLTLKKSSCCRAATSFQMCMSCSNEKPPSMSWMQSRHSSVTTHCVSRMRFANDPPYSSLRWLKSGERNWSSKCPGAMSSIPSRPPALARFAAAPKSRITRAMSVRSISLGKPARYVGAVQFLRCAHWLQAASHPRHQAPCDIFGSDGNPCVAF